MTKYGDFTALRAWLMDVPLIIKAKTGDEMNSGARAMLELIMERLDCAPEFDVVKVKHGYVIEHQGAEDEYYCECSVCKTHEVNLGDKYCSECGARLDGRRDK